MESTLRALFGEKLPQLLHEVSKRSSEYGWKIHLVGGAVRDLLLGLRSDDIDVVVEGDAIELVKSLTSEPDPLFPRGSLATKPVLFPRYGTAKLSFVDEIAPAVRALDFATARREHYPVPGGAPKTQPGDLGYDLARRDFAVNAIALECLPDGGLELRDLHGGRDDLERKALRVLHDKSFVDDPARLIRGLRFAARFGFRFDEKTELLVTDAIAERRLETLPKRRLLDELRKALAERSPIPVLEALNERKLLTQIHPAIELQIDVLTRAGREYPSLLRALFPSLSDAEYLTALESFGLSKKEARTLSPEAPHGR